MQRSNAAKHVSNTASSNVGNSVIISPDRSSYENNAQVILTCESGSISGPETKTCQEGAFQPSEETTCNEIDNRKFTTSTTSSLHKL